MAKYDPLRDHLAAHSGPLTMTFAEIDSLVGGLPPTARSKAQWWANNAQGHSQAAAWLGLGRETACVNRLDETVTFTAPATL